MLTIAVRSNSILTLLLFIHKEHAIKFEMKYFLKSKYEVIIILTFIIYSFGEQSDFFKWNQSTLQLKEQTESFFPSTHLQYDLSSGDIQIAWDPGSSTSQTQSPISHQPSSPSCSLTQFTVRISIIDDNQTRGLTIPYHGLYLSNVTAIALPHDNPLLQILNSTTSLKSNGASVAIDLVPNPSISCPQAAPTPYQLVHHNLVNLRFPATADSKISLPDSLKFVTKSRPLTPRSLVTDIHSALSHGRYDVNSTHSSQSVLIECQDQGLARSHIVRRTLVDLVPDHPNLRDIFGSVSAVVDGLIPGRLYKVSAYPCFAHYGGPVCVVPFVTSFTEHPNFLGGGGGGADGHHREDPVPADDLVRLKPLPPRITFFNVSEGGTLLVNWLPPLNSTTFDAYSITVGGKSPLFTETTFKSDQIDVRPWLSGDFHKTRADPGVFKIQTVSGFWNGVLTQYSDVVTLDIEQILERRFDRKFITKEANVLTVSSLRPNSFVLDWPEKSSLAEIPPTRSNNMSETDPDDTEDGELTFDRDLNRPFYFLNVSTPTKLVENFFIKNYSTHYIVTDLEPCTEYDIQLDVYHNLSLQHSYSRVVYTPPPTPLSLSSAYTHKHIKFSWKSPSSEQGSPDTCIGKTTYEAYIRRFRYGGGISNSSTPSFHEGMKSENSSFFLQIPDSIDSYVLDLTDQRIKPCIYLFVLKRILKIARDSVITDSIERTDLMDDVEALALSDSVSIPFTIAPRSFQNVSGHQADAHSFTLRLEHSLNQCFTGMGIMKLKVDCEADVQKPISDPLIVEEETKWIINFKDLSPSTFYSCAIRAGPWLKDFDHFLTHENDTLEFLWSQPYLASWTMAPSPLTKISLSRLDAEDPALLDSTPNPIPHDSKDLGSHPESGIHTADYGDDYHHHTYGPKCLNIDPSTLPCIFLTDRSSLDSAIFSPPISTGNFASGCHGYSERGPLGTVMDPVPLRHILASDYTIDDANRSDDPSRHVTVCRVMLHVADNGSGRSMDPASLAKYVLSWESDVTSKPSESKRSNDLYGNGFLVFMHPFIRESGMLTRASDTTQELGETTLNSKIFWIDPTVDVGIRDGSKVSLILPHLCSGLGYRFEVMKVENGLASFRDGSTTTTSAIIAPTCSSTVKITKTGTDYAIVSYTLITGGYFQYYNFSITDLINRATSHLTFPSHITPHDLCHVADPKDGDNLTPIQSFTLKDLLPGSAHSIELNVWSQGIESLHCSATTRFNIVPQSIPYQGIKVHTTERSIQLVWQPPRVGHYEYFIVYLSDLTTPETGPSVTAKNLGQGFSQSPPARAMFRVFPPNNGPSVGTDDAEREDVTYLITDLKPFTLYGLKVVTVCNGSLSDPRSLEAKTQGSVPGLVKEFRISDIKPYKLTLSWNLPDPIGGYLVGYRINVTEKDVPSDVRYHALLYTTRIFPMDVSGLSAGHEYEFNAQAKTLNGFGPFLPTPLVVKLPIWAPPTPPIDAVPALQKLASSQDTSSSYIAFTDANHTRNLSHPPTDASVTATTLTIVFDYTYAFSDLHGYIVEYAVIVSEVPGANREITVNFEGSRTFPERMPTWSQVKSMKPNEGDTWPAYRATPPGFNMNADAASEGIYNRIFRSPNQSHTNSMPLSRRDVLRKRGSTRYATFVIGEQSDCDVRELGNYCNGPLRPGRAYRVKVRAYTTPDLFTETRESEIMRTLALPFQNMAAGRDSDSGAGSKIAPKAMVIASLSIAALSILALLMSLVWRRRKGFRRRRRPANKRPPGSGDSYDNGTKSGTSGNKGSSVTSSSKRNRLSFNFENANYDFGGQDTSPSNLNDDQTSKGQRPTNELSSATQLLDSVPKRAEVTSRSGSRLKRLIPSIVAHKIFGHNHRNGCGDEIDRPFKEMGMKVITDGNVTHTQLVDPSAVTYSTNFKGTSGPGQNGPSTTTPATSGIGMSSSINKPTCSVPPCPNGFPGSRIDTERSVKPSTSEPFAPVPRQIITVDTFAERMRELSADGDIGFAEEFDELRYEGKGQPCAASQQPYNLEKNRFTNILPYDHSRVKLLPLVGLPGSDYINSNFIPGFNSKQEYIAAQGPLPNTCNDFWRMIWEQNSRVVIMLTKFIELGKDKCTKYWPMGSIPIGTAKYYGDLMVEVMEETTYPEWNETELRVSLGTQSRVIKHYHFISWPDFGIPENPEILLRFIGAVRAKVPYGRKPLTIHCSAGVGRTGAFICVDQILQQIASQGTIDVHGVVKEMRMHRMGMIQNDHQYTYLYQCIERHLALLSRTASDIIQPSNPVPSQDQIFCDQNQNDNLTSGSDDGQLSAIL